MKKHIYITGLILCLLAAACSEDTEDKLNGKWQLQEVSQDGVSAKVDTIFYNFQDDLFQYQIYSPSGDSYRSLYGYRALNSDNVLALELAYPPASVSAFLPYTDWTSAQQSFTLEKVSGSRLVLSASGKTYTFRKF